MAAKIVKGELTLLLQSASGLDNVEFMGKQDPYAIISIGSTTHRSHTHEDGGKNPVWNQSFVFPRVRSDFQLRVELHDENMLMPDVFIGVAKTYLRQIIPTAPTTLQLPVTNKKGKEAGTVSVSITFKAAGEEEKLPEWVLPTYKDTDCWNDYATVKVLGKGSYGTTHLAKDKKTGEEVAVKVISKRKITSQLEVEDVRREVQIMHHLAGHTNVVHLQHVYEDRNDVCLAMELCSGGELLDSLSSRGKYSEKDAAAAMRTLMSVIAHCHNMGVMHRDLKLENMLLSDKSPDAILKVADWGLSTFFKEDETFSDCLGSPHFMAPEVLRRQYSKEADVWSCGVIMYVLLCGYPPFQGECTKKTFQAIMNAPLELPDKPWGHISEPAKELLRNILERDPRKRMTAADVLQHAWLREDGIAASEPIELEVLTRMKKFSAGNRLRKEAIKLMATNLPIDEIMGLKEIFHGMDVDKSGSITAKEFAAALRRKGSNLPEDHIQQLVEDADIDGDGLIDYEEFLAATINKGKLEREDRLRAAFQTFDADGNGVICREELTQILCAQGVNQAGIDQIIADVDTDGNGQIDYREFCEMLRDM